jgi:hypothetical protein
MTAHARFLLTNAALDAREQEFKVAKERAAALRKELAEAESAERAARYAFEVVEDNYNLAREDFMSERKTA